MMQKFSWIQEVYSRLCDWQLRRDQDLFVLLWSRTFQERHLKLCALFRSSRTTQGKEVL